jgi:hypothetical protein
MTKRRYIKVSVAAALLLGALTIAFFKWDLFKMNGYSSSSISLVPAELNTQQQAAEEKDIADEGSTDYFSIFRLINGLIPDQKRN